MGDYIRSFIGLLLTALPATQLPVNAFGFWLCLTFALMFLGLAVNTFYRQMSHIVLTDERIEFFPGPNIMSWESVREIKLSYFSTRTDRKDGWMQLTIDSGIRKLRVDSRIDDFHTLAATALEKTKYSNVVLSDTSSRNFESLGLNPSSQTPI